MRLATAADEIKPLKDPRIQANPAYLSVIVLSRVITELGDLNDVNPRIIENLYASDLAFLQTLYQELNGNGTMNVPAHCPNCDHSFEVTVNGLGGG
jgi:phage FluMu protein gp41